MLLSEQFPLPQPAPRELCRLRPAEFDHWRHRYIANLPTHRGALRVEAGNLSIDLRTGSVAALRGDTPVLTDSLALLLLVLALCAGRTVSKNMLRVAFYGSDDRDGKVFDVMLCYLRKRLAGACYIQTVWGRGWWLDGKVVEVEDP